MATATPLLDRSSRTGCHHEFKTFFGGIVWWCAAPNRLDVHFADGCAIMVGE